MSWLFWQNNSNAGTSPPSEWVTLYERLRTIIPRKYVEKVELASFVIRGSPDPDRNRRARWTLNKADPEYSTHREALDVAKRLSALILLSRNPPRIDSNIFAELRCIETDGCNWYVGHEGACTTRTVIFPATVCVLCGRRIDFDDFTRNGRKDPNSISMAHRSPLSRTTRGHNARAVGWAHKSCNTFLSALSIDEAVDVMRSILEYNGYRVTRRR